MVLGDKVLKSEEKAQIESQLQGHEIMAITVAQLLFARPNPKIWNNSHKLGAIVLSKPKAKRYSTSAESSFTIKLFEVMNNGELIWEHQISGQSDYVMDRKHFHSFACADCMAGLNFADEFEAEEFGQRVLQAISDLSRATPPAIMPRSSSSAAVPETASPPPAPSRPPPPAVRSGGTVRAAPPPPAQTAAVSPPVLTSTPTSSSTYSSPHAVDLSRTASGRSSDANSFFGFNKKPKGKAGKGAGARISKFEISGPQEGSFRHLSHVGVSDGGFQMQGIPPEWKSLFQKAGLTEAQLQDKKNAKFIRKFMEENQNKIAEMKTAPSRAPPPPPQAVSGSRGPGPAPPPRSGGMPPPPPARAGSFIPPPPPPRTNNAPVSPISDRGAPASNAPAPPPPPPPPVGFSGGEARPQSPERKAIAKPVPAPVADGRDNLMAEIRKAKGVNGLKPADERQITAKDIPQTAEDIENDLVAALSNALTMRKAAVAGDSDDEESEEDDDEWED